MAKAAAFSFVRGMVRQTYSHTGTPSVDPAVVFEMADPTGPQHPLQGKGPGSGLTTTGRAVRVTMTRSRRTSTDTAKLRLPWPARRRKAQARRSE